MEITQQIIKKYLGCKAKDLTDAGICPTCFDRATNRSVFGDDSKLKVYEDADIECLFIDNPRADGHMIISSKQHYQDFSVAPDYVNNKIISFSKQLATIIKQVYGCERVYLCTMCDGPANHYHMQLIPRYNFEERGSKNFVKPRIKYIFDADKFMQVKNLIQNFAKNYKN